MEYPVARKVKKRHDDILLAAKSNSNSNTNEPPSEHLQLRINVVGIPRTISTDYQVRKEPREFPSFLLVKHQASSALLDCTYKHVENRVWFDEFCTFRSKEQPKIIKTLFYHKFIFEQYSSIIQSLSIDY
jgi:hypothetical protein